MRARLVFPNVEFMQDSGDTVRVKLGENFTMQMVADDPISLSWATTKDQVLNVSEATAELVSITALALGTSKVMLINSSLAAEFHLDIEVYDESTVTVGAEFGNVRLR